MPETLPIGQAISAPESYQTDYDRLNLLLEVSESIASHRDLGELFIELAQRLPSIVPFDFINLVLHDPTRDVMRLHTLVAPESSTIRTGMELPVDQAPAGSVLKSQQSLMIEVHDAAVETRFPKLTLLLRENNVQSYCVVPLTTAMRRLGAMGFGTAHRRLYEETEIKFMEHV